MRKRGTLLVAAGVALALAAGAAAWIGNAAADDAPAAEKSTVGTVAIARTDLSTEHVLNGKLGFGVAQPVKGGRAGMVTWLPAAGTVVTRGKVLYRVDDEPVPLFLGGIPLYRPLAARNTVGRDVAVVADNLKALGYRIGDQPAAGTTLTQDVEGGVPSPSAGVRTTVRRGDAVLTGALIAAIKKWQGDVGMTADGRLEAGDLAVLPGEVRVESATARVGDPATAPLLAVTPTQKVVTVEAGADRAGALTEGDPATVRLPDGALTPGRVAAISTVAQGTADGVGAQGPKVAVTVTLDDPNAAAHLDAADVRVTIAGETRAGVLAVPVGALLALREGGYAVQLTDGRLIPVQLGLFAQGLVEISGPGVAEGVTVVTTS